MNNRHIGYLIKSINDKLKMKADEDLKSHGLTLSQSRIVDFLSQQNGTATQKEIETFLEVSHPTVVGLVSRMEQNGIVYTYFDANNRSKAVRLTDRAVTIAKDINDTIDETEHKILLDLTDEEVKNLEKALTTILRNIEK